MAPVRMLLLSLGCTLVLELLFAVALGKRGKDLLLVCLVNVMTNPVVVLVYYLAVHFTALQPVLVKAVLEAFAVLAEAYLYKTYGSRFRRPLLFSLGANMFSFWTGELLSWIGGLL
jgi:hypothetical protein